MVKWEYGKHNDRWKVETGDVWMAYENLPDPKGNLIPRAMMVCGELEMTMNLDSLCKKVLGSRARMAYIDPPYRLSDLRSFYTKAELECPTMDYFIFLQAIWQLTLFVPIVCMENSTVNDDVILKGLSAYRPYLRRFSITYYETKPSSLWVSSDERLPDLFVAGIEGADDSLTPSIAIKHLSKEGDVIIDCCMGRGLTMRSALEAGRRFGGIELNPKRLAVALTLLEMDGYVVRKEEL